MPRCTGITQKGKQCARMVASGCECHQHKTPEDCPICFEVIDKKSLLKTACNHSFHFQCLKTWLTTKSSCPCCRGSVKVSHRYINVYEDRACVISWCRDIREWYTTTLPKGFYRSDGPAESVTMTTISKEMEFTHINRVEKTGYPYVVIYN